MDGEQGLLWESRERASGPLPDWFSVGSVPIEFTKNVQAGRHPFGAELGAEGTKCGDCAHVVKVRKWRRCKLVRTAFSPGSDLRLKWRACQFYRDGSAS